MTTMRRHKRREEVSVYRSLPAGRIDENHERFYEANGCVGTEYGIVMVSAWDMSTPDEPSTSRGHMLDFIWQGRAYRLWNNWKRPTVRGLRIIAGRFARDVAEGVYDHNSEA